MTVQEIKNIVWQFLYDKGLPEKSISAVMGNIYAESGFDPNLVEHGNGIGFGLCQWSFERRVQLENYGTSLEHQLEFLWAELSGDLGDTGASFQWINKSEYLKHTEFISGNGTIEDLTKAFCFCWERPNEELSHIDVRIAKALEYYDEYANGVDPPIDPPEPTEGDIWEKILDSSYNIKQLTDSEIEILKQASIGNTARMKYTFNRSKKEVGTNFLGICLTFDNKEYIIKDVRRNGFISIDFQNSKCYKYVNPKYLDIEIPEEGET